MHKADATRLANLSEAERKKLEHLDGDTHIITGSLEGHGSAALVSSEGKLDAEIIKLERTAGGGIEYQFAIFVEEPAPAQPEVPKTPEEQATEYLVGKGQSEEDAAKAVARFGSARVLARKAKDDADQAGALEEELDALLKPAKKKNGKKDEDASVQ